MASNRFVHGLTRDSAGKTSKIYSQWTQMKQRCFNKGHPHYHNYGGRGITVCDRWKNSVKDFSEDIGPRPSPAHSIERDDNDGDYTPDNCRWATRSEQNANQRDRYRAVPKVTQHMLNVAPTLKATGLSTKAIGQILNVGHTTVENILKGNYSDAIEHGGTLYIMEKRKINHPVKRVRRSRGQRGD